MLWDILNNYLRIKWVLIAIRNGSFLVNSDVNLFLTQSCCLSSENLEKFMDYGAVFVILEAK